MASPSSETVVITSILPIRLETIPALYAYQLLPLQAAVTGLGGKVSFRAQLQLGGHWAFTDQRLVTDRLSTMRELYGLLRELWRHDPARFGMVRSVQRDGAWQPTPLSQAQFVARAIFPVDHAPAIDVLLRQQVPPRTIGQVQVRVNLAVQGRVFAGAPCLDLIFRTDLGSTESLPALARRLGAVSVLTGLLVEDMTGGSRGFRGRIGSITQGLSAADRERLWHLSQRQVMKQHLRQAPTTDWVVTLHSRGQTVDYVASALRVIVQPENFGQLRIDGQALRSSYIMSPATCGGLLTTIATHLQQRGLLGRAVSARTHRDRFLSPAAVGYPPKIRVGGGHVVAWEPYNSMVLWNALRQHGCFKVAPSRLQLAVMNAIGPGTGTSFVRALIEAFRAIKITVEVGAQVDCPALTRAAQEQALAAVRRLPSCIVLGLFPDRVGRDRSAFGPYDIFKQLTVGQGLASQVCYTSTMGQRFAPMNVALQILAKTGTIARVLAEPLPGVDFVVGIDIARRLRAHASGTINLANCTHVYASSGEPIWSSVQTTQQEGETIPTTVIEQLLPPSACRGQRVLLLRDGPFRGGEAPRLLAWGQEIGATFLLVAVTKEAPRILEIKDRAFIQPMTGTVALPDGLTGEEAIVVSSLPPTKTSVPRPLLIQSYAPYPILDAVRSVLALTALHAGSVRPPRQPAPLHYVQRIGQLALKGILPRELSGSVAYWV